MIGFSWGLDSNLCTTRYRIDGTSTLRKLGEGGGAYTGRVMRALVSAVRFWWSASAGYRLRPWHSPYLRWRVETFTGKPAATLTLRDFIELAQTERKQVGSYLGWLSEMRTLSREDRTD